MKYLLLFFIFPCLVTCGFAQNPEDFPLVNRSNKLSEYLISLAWQNNPSNDNFFQHTIIAKEDIKLARRGPWRELGVSFNLNEGNLRSSGSNGNIFFPRYNFAGTFNLGSVFDTPNKTKIATRKLKIAENDLNQRRSEMKAELLRRYQIYLTGIELLKNAFKAEEDANANLIQISTLFRSGTAPFEDYNTAQSAYYSAQETRIKITGDLNLAKIDLEELIGVRLEDVQANFKN